MKIFMELLTASHIEVHCKILHGIYSNCLYAIDYMSREKGSFESIETPIRMQVGKSL